MRKNFFIGIAAVAVVAIAAVNVNYASQNKNLSALSMANVEALGSEIGGACGGCSSSCRKAYCCTVIINGTGFALNRCS